MIRIYSGQLKNRVVEQIEPVDAKITRPALAVVRKSVFEMLGNLKGMRVLDLFAGTGVLGFEALSQGAEEVYFIDKDSRNIKNIDANLKRFSMSDRGFTFPTDYRMALKALSKRGVTFDVVISDPPYKWSLKFDTLEYVRQYDILVKNGRLVYLHAKGEKIDTKRWTVLQRKTFSATEIMVMENEGDLNERDISGNI